MRSLILSFIFVEVMLFEKFKNKTTLKITHYMVLNCMGSKSQIH